MECYICCEDTPPLLTNICNCTNLYIQNHCLEKVLVEVNSHGEGKCSVCNHSYNNVRIVKRFHLNMHWIPLQILNIATIMGMIWFFILILDGTICINVDGINLTINFLRKCTTHMKFDSVFICLIFIICLWQTNAAIRKNLQHVPMIITTKKYEICH